MLVTYIGVESSYNKALFYDEIHTVSVYHCACSHPIIRTVLKQEQLRALGKRIQELRKDRSLTQAQLAETCDLTINYVGKIERGESQPSLEVLLSIANSLKVNISTLFVYLDRPLTREDAKRRIRELLDHL